jgi:hypothetical protein
MSAPTTFANHLALEEILYVLDTLETLIMNLDYMVETHLASIEDLLVSLNASQT